MRPADINETLLLDLYVNQKKTIRDCAPLVGASEASVRRRLKKLGIEIRSPIRRLIEDVSDEQVAKLYWDEQLSIAETAKRLGRSETFVRGRLKKSGRGSRTVKEGARLWRGSDEIPDSRLVYMHDVLKMSCLKISEYFDKSEEFVRQRFIAMGKDRRKTVGEFNGSWKGGITDVRSAVRSCSMATAWRDTLFASCGYRSELSGDTGTLNCHHIHPFRSILKSSWSKHSCLPPEYRNIAVVHDERFYDLENGLVVTKEEHDAIEDCHDNANPWWKIWRIDPECAIRKSGLLHDDFSVFDSNGMIAVSDCEICKAKVAEVRNVVRYEHYLGTIPVSKIMLVARIGNIPVGVATFGCGTNKNIGRNTLELTRLCVPYYVHRPFSCDFIGLCLDYIRKEYKDVKTIVAFADSSVGHNGGVYRMAGWQKDGRTPPSYVYFDTTTFEMKHKAACRRVPGVDMTERELAESRGWIKVPTQHKYRYTITV